MKKRLISLIVAVVMLCSMLCPAAYADDETVSFDICTHEWETPIRSGYSITIPGSDVTFSVKTEQCKKCKWYKHVATIFIAEFTYYSPLNVDANGLVPTELATYWANVWYNNFGKNATATKFAAGGGSTSGGGVGRPKGYADDNGTPNIYPSGSLVYMAEPYGIGAGEYFATTGFRTSLSNSTYVIPSPSASGTSFISGYGATAIFKFVAPVSGVYYIGSEGGKYNLGTFDLFYNNDWISFDYLIVPSKKYEYSCTVNKGDTVYFCYTHRASQYNRYAYRYSLTSIPIFVDLLADSSITTTNNITINNNTWNGNIYTDNSTNLTYIYPQYTTINEKNETVTNISNNPIIYNNETKQYYTYDSVTNNYYYITYETTPTPTPSPSPAPAPTWTPGGGATRGGGVGRHPSDTDAADWTLHYYILNNRRYDAYYALKKTEVNTETKLPWVDNKKYISTTQIPIANGQYTVSVPDGVYWRVWQWDEASKTLTGVNSSNWHGNNFTFLFNTTDEYIFEFCKSDGSEFSSPKDVVLKLKNEKITEYEPGDTIVEEPSPSPSPSPSESPAPAPTPDPGTTPTPTPKPGGGTVPTPGGDGSGGNSSGISGGNDEGLFGWLWDLLKDLVKAILKAIFKILSNILGFLIWIVERVGLLLPFMPAPAIAALGAGVVLIFVIRIIRFIRG